MLVQKKFTSQKKLLNLRICQSIHVDNNGFLHSNSCKIVLSDVCKKWFLEQDEINRHHRVRTLINAVNNWNLIDEDLQDAFCMDGTRSQGYSIIDDKMFFWKIFWFEDELMETKCTASDNSYPVFTVFTPGEPLPV